MRIATLLLLILKTYCYVCASTVRKYDFLSLPQGPPPRVGCRLLRCETSSVSFYFLWTYILVKV